MVVRKLGLSGLALVVPFACAQSVEPEGPPGADIASNAATIGAGGTTTSPGAIGSGPASSAASGGAGGQSSEGGGPASTSASTSGVGGGGNGTLRVQYKTGDTNGTDQQIRAHLKLFNDGATAVNLTNVTIRYWFTQDGGSNLVYNCDYAALGCGALSGTFMTASGTNADHYMEVSFNSGSLGPGQDTGEMQTRFHTSDYANLPEANDYSYDGTKTSFADWLNVAVYDGGNLVWGTEP